MSGAKIFHLILIKPTRYDLEGYPIQWRRSVVPSNSLGCLYGLSADCRERQVLGAGVDIRIHAIDECNTRVRPERLIEMVRTDNATALIGLVGVQSNQFPRAVDLARPFRAAGLPVCIGGFHVSGCLSMLPEMPVEMREAQDMGISFFAGEAEEQRLDEVLQDAHAGKLKPVYDHMKHLPNITGEPLPVLPQDVAFRVFSGFSSFDLGRGCPFECSFCCIINVQGRKSRFRSVGDMEKIIRAYHAMGVTTFFITDDNFARNKNWELYFDRLIELREKEGLHLRFILQVDTLCHKIPRFIEKAARAGADQIFLGLENINPDNLTAIKKRQNKITDYREMLLEWKKYNTVITAGYIVGLPHDTRESVIRDVEVIKRELPIDTLNFTVLTPLPGSEDHRRMTADGTWMDPDLNKYNLFYWVTRHPAMTDDELNEMYAEAWGRFYNYKHMKTVLRRMTAFRSGKKLTTMNRLYWYGMFWRIYRMSAGDGGISRRKYRTDRRHGQKLENPLLFYPKYWAGSAGVFVLTNAIYLWLRLTLLWIYNHPKRFEYRDRAMMPAAEDDPASMELYTQTRGGVDAANKRQQHDAIKAKAREKAHESVG